MKSLFLSSLLALGLLAVPAQAAEYPAKPITLMTAFNAGGGSDVSHRLLEKFAKGVFERLRMECNLYVWHRCIILGHADKVQGEEAVLPGEAGEIGVHESAGDLPGTVGPEVEEDHAVAGFDGALFVQNGGDHEFVGDAFLIGFLDSAHRAAALDAFAVDHGGIGFLYPVPGVVPVHGVEAAHDRGNLARADALGLLDQLFHVLRTGGGGHVTAV